MDYYQTAQLLESRKVLVDINDTRDPIEIGLVLGIVELKHIYTEASGYFDKQDVITMRRQGFLVLAVGFGQAVYKAVSVEQSERLL